ncbi:serine protease FAM111A-like isoform X2 [Onychostoma macrolepis]|uniref:serine protease FAM111A-like isoform X2 n=1 Tax=Onychostoma macrolepis TaxID=369639 RepID=UPI00272ACA8F|nr:serine protease FAM111A-like isoform X2 [Onychostoma macrolepis]
MSRVLNMKDPRCASLFLSNKRPKGERHTFKFSTRNGKEIIAEYDTSQTVFGAINKFDTFSSPDKMGKEIIIIRSKGTISGAVVKTDFPCCLIEDDENFKISLYNSENASTNQETTTDTDPQSLVTFYIRTRGKKIKTIMKSSVFATNNLDYVCVFAHKGDILEEALQRDGRFIDNIFDNSSELIDDGDRSYKMNLTVDHCDGMKFQLYVNNPGKKPKNRAKNNGKPNNTEQKTTQEIKTKVTDPSTENHAAQNTAGNSGDLAGDSSQNPNNTRQEKNQDGNTKFTNPSTKQYVAKPIEDSEEILEMLRDQYPVLLKQLQQRKKLKDKSEVQKFFREEYGKSVENFLKVKKVKQLMRLSDSVCQIRQGESALGTGFLLFDRYILTNAHVIGESTDVTKVNTAEFTAVFGYEDLDSKDSKRIPVEQLTAYFLGMDDEGRGQICIVGHPGEGVKKMDPCFIIERDNRLEAANKHASENQHLIHLIKEKYSEQKWDFSAYENEITYNSCFFHGSSGSPVFDVDCNLIGIHTGGYKYKEEGDTTCSVMEYGFSMQPILDSIRAQAKIKGLPNIINAIDAYSKQQNQIDTKMESAEESDKN